MLKFVYKINFGIISHSPKEVRSLTVCTWLLCETHMQLQQQERREPTPESGRLPRPHLGEGGGSSLVGNISDKVPPYLTLLGGWNVYTFQSIPLSQVIDNIPPIQNT